MADSSAILADALPEDRRGLDLAGNAVAVIVIALAAPRPWPFLLRAGSRPAIAACAITDGRVADAVEPPISIGGARPVCSSAPKE